MRIAAIDIGSNSIKVVVVEAAAADSFAVLLSDRDVVRLGRDTLQANHLAPTAIQRAAETIKRFRALAEARGAQTVVTIATAAVRAADNAADFISEVERVAGVRVEILSGLEEARLVGLAALHRCGAGCASLFNLDIGGGSTEISVYQNGEPVALHSLKIGCVGATEKFLKSDPVKPKELRALSDEVRAMLERPVREMRGLTWECATATSGTGLAVGRILALQRRGKNGASDAEGGEEFKLSELAKFNERAAAATVAERRTWEGMSDQRAEVIIAGGQILEGVMRAFGIKTMRSCEWALREGVVIDALRELEIEAQPPLDDDADPRLKSVHAVAQRFGCDPSHARTSARFAETIFDALAAPYKLARHERTLLAAAALLHDAGYYIAHEDHHKHTHYLIKHSELTGFSESERHLIANIARYHRGALPKKDRHADFAALGAKEQEIVWKLGGILRVADALDSTYENRIEEIECARAGKTFTITLRSASDCGQELWAAKRKSDMFEQAFNLKLEFACKAPQRDEQRAA